MTYLSTDAHYWVGKFTAAWNRFTSASSSDESFDAKCEYRDYAIDLALQMMNEKPEPTIDDLLASRTVVEYRCDNDGIHKILSPIPMSVMVPAFNELITAGYIGRFEGDHPCIQCRGNSTCVAYDLPGHHDGPFFNICLQCWNVFEQVSEYFEDMAIERREALKEAVLTHMEGQHTIERIAPVQRDTSSVGQTAPKSSPSSTTSTLYATGDQ